MLAATQLWWTPPNSFIISRRERMNESIWDALDLRTQMNSTCMPASQWELEIPHQLWAGTELLFYDLFALSTTNVSHATLF
jgi:hypothetical protein